MVSKLRSCRYHFILKKTTTSKKAKKTHHRRQQNSFLFFSHSLLCEIAAAHDYVQASRARPRERAVSCSTKESPPGPRDGGIDAAHARGAVREDCKGERGNSCLALLSSRAFSSFFFFFFLFSIHSAKRTLKAHNKREVEENTEKMTTTTIHVKATSGSKITLEVDLSTTVGNLKTTLAAADKADIPAPQQRLIYKGHVLKDEKTLESYGAFTFLVASVCCRLSLLCSSPTPAPSPPPWGPPSVLMFRLYRRHRPISSACRGCAYAR